MKKEILLLIIIFEILLCSCKVTKEVLASNKFDNKIGEEELSREIKENVYPFTINSKICYGCPIIKYTINGEDALFYLDTGSEYNAITNKGLETMGYNIYDFQVSLLPLFIKNYGLDNSLIEEVKNGNKKIINKLRKKLLKSFKYGNAYLVKLNGEQWAYGRMLNSKMNGILGYPFLRKGKYVTLDFKNNLLYFESTKKEDNIIPMHFNDYNHLEINFTYKGATEIGIIDTGNYTFTPRNDFGKENTVPITTPNDMGSQEYIKNYRLKKKIPIIHTYDDIEIGSETFNKIKGRYANIWFTGYDKNTQIFLQSTNCIGCEFFNNHILQFDFNNMEMNLSK